MKLKWIALGTLILTMLFGACSNEKPKKAKKKREKKKVVLVSEGSKPDGTGSEDDPYRIATLDNLRWLSTTPDSWSCHFVQTADINAAETRNWNDGEGFAPIGDHYFQKTYEEKPFCGSYDGNNHVIDSLYINRPKKVGQALFAFAKKALFTNLQMMNLSVHGRSAAGIVADLIDSSVLNCQTTGVLAGKDSVGGIAAFASSDSSYSRLENCTSSVQISGMANLGVFIGSLRSGVLVENCYYNMEESTINGEHREGIGALEPVDYKRWVDRKYRLSVGQFFNAKGDFIEIHSVDDLSKLRYTGQIPGLRYRLMRDLDMSSAGNLQIPYFSGILDGNGKKIKNLTITGDSLSCTALFKVMVDSEVYDLTLEDCSVSGFILTAGFCSQFNHSVMTNCICSGEISGTWKMGLLTAECNYSTLKGCKSDGVLHGDFDVGLVSGLPYQSIITDCESRGSVTSTGQSGGCFGMIMESDVVNSVNFADVIGKDNGGFSGSIYRSKVTDCANYGNITRECMIGGFTSSCDYSQVTRCANHGDVKGDGSEEAGFAGSTMNSTVYNCYNTGSVQGNDTVSGIAGTCYSSKLYNCLNFGDVKGHTLIAGVVANLWDYNYLHNCYSGGNIIGQMTTGGITGMNMQSIVSNCVSYSEVYSDSIAAGITGQNRAYSSIMNCSVNGKIRSEFGTGGISAVMLELSSAFETLVLAKLKSNKGLGIITAGPPDVLLGGNAIWSPDCIESEEEPTYSTEQLRDINTYLDAGWFISGPGHEVEGSNWKIDPKINDGLPYLAWLEEVGLEKGRVENFDPEKLYAMDAPLDENPLVTIRFYVRPGETASLKIVSQKGDEVRTYSTFSEGYHEVAWDMLDNDGNEVEETVFFYHLKSETLNRVRVVMAEDPYSNNGLSYSSY